MTVNVRQAASSTPLPIQLVFLGEAFAMCLLALLCGCAAPKQADCPADRPFAFSSDTFSYANGLVWEYKYDANGKWTTRRREPRPTYSQHCFVVSRTTCQFFENARFDSGLPKADEETYRSLVGRVVSSSLADALPPERKIVIPGYTDLRSFSEDYESLLQAECGGAWRCYFQRGNWRMIFPFSRHHQEQMAEQLQEQLKEKRPAVVHVVRFPSLSINHAVVVYKAKAESNHVDFVTYDPNEPASPTVIRYERGAKTFYLGHNAYFPGGRVDVYEIYDRFPY
jgi:hypothetical protein